MHAKLLALLALLLLAHASHIRLHLAHPLHAKQPNRHQLTSSTRSHQVRHDMRVFTTNQLHLSHQSTAEGYELNDMGYYFTLNLTVGGLPYALSIDTGSSDFFIKGESSPGKPKVKYSCPSCRRNNQKLTIGYLDGSLSTYKVNLEVKLGSHTFQESVLVAYTAPHNFEASEGLVGLSFPQLAANKDPTFVQTLINNKFIDVYAFGVNLNFQQHQKSFISFGRPDFDLFEGELTMYPISRGYSYEIGIKGISVGDGKLLSISSALLDTGNTCISIPDEYEDELLNQFNTEGNSCGFDNEEYAPMFSLLRCKVNDHSALPSLHIHIGGEVYEVDHNVYMQRCVQEEDFDLCDTYIESVSRQRKLFLGDGFFNRYYTYFDITNRQIGIARNKDILSYQNMYVDESEMDNEDADFFDSL